RHNIQDTKTKHRDTVSTQLDTKHLHLTSGKYFYLDTSLSVLSCLLQTVSLSLHMRHPLNRAQPLGLNCIQHLDQLSQDPTIMGGGVQESLRAPSPFFATVKRWR